MVEFHASSIKSDLEPITVGTDMIQKESLDMSIVEAKYWRLLKSVPKAAGGWSCENSDCETTQCIDSLRLVRE